MTDTPSTPNKWSFAMRDGLLLSLVTIACSTISQMAQVGWLSILVWLVQIIGSIWLLAFFMKRYGAANTEESRTTSYGVMICLFSSIICAVFSYLSVQFFFPETMDAMTVMISNAVSSTPNMTPEVEDGLYKLVDSMPQITCVLTLFKCFLEGLIFSAIIGASTAKRKDPFGNGAPQAEDKDELA